jgi:hypothetical protein
MYHSGGDFWFIILNPSSSSVVPPALGCNDCIFHGIRHVESSKSFLTIEFGGKRACVQDTTTFEGPTPFQVPQSYT